MPGLFATEEEESPDVGGVEATQEAMGPVPGSAEPKMKAKAQRALLFRNADEAKEETPAVEQPKSKGIFVDKSETVESSTGTLFKASNFDHIYDDTPSNPFIENLSTVPDDGQHFTRDAVNFLMGPEMGVVGMKWDTQGFSWEWENAKKQWSEQPMWLNLLATTSLFGTAAYPIAKAAYMTTKVGRVGEARGLTGSPVDEMAKWKRMGMVESSHADELDFDTRKMLRIHEANTEKWDAFRNRALKAEQGEPMGVKDKVMYEFEKRFTNTYFNMANDNNAKMAYNARLDQLWKNERLGQFFVGIPDGAKGDLLYQHQLHKLDPTNVPKPSGLTPEEIGWADRTGDAMKRTQQEMLDEGIITQETFDRIGEMHLPAQYKGTAEADLGMSRTLIAPLNQPGKGSQYVALRMQKVPRLNSETLKSRAADLPEIYKRLQAGELITDPTDLTVRGHVTDRLLLNNFKFVRDMSIDNRYSVSHSDMLTKFTKNGTFAAAAAKKAGFVHLDGVGGEAVPILRRMLEKKGGKIGLNGELPWIRKEVFNEVFGEHGMFAQSHNAAGFMDAITSVFKSMKTVTSIPTHFNNGMGNAVMLSMAGFNPFTPSSMGLMHDVSKAFKNMSEVWKTAKKAGINSRDIIDKSTFNMGSTIINGKTFDLTKEMLHPAARELLEENSLNATEGFAHLEELYGRAREGSVTKWMINKALRAKEIAQVGDKVKWFDKMNEAYVAEDMIPKMSLFIHYRSKGLTPAAAAIETGRRLPMYNTVGSAVVQGRKWAFPWLTFTTEAARITKNNLMDHPLRTMPWLHAPAIVQSLMAGAEGRSYEDVQEGKRNLPLFGQSATTVIGTGQSQTALAGAATGAFAGAAAGMLKGGAAGGVIGGVMGAAAGAGVLGMINKDEDQLRGAMMDWLPHSAFMLTSLSPDFQWSNAQSVIEQMPSQPLAIIKPFMETLSGETAWGQPIGSEGLGDSIKHMMAGYIGLMAPPLIQKYGFRVTTPDISASQALIGKDLSFDITNVSRGLIDTGIQIDPATGKPGNLSQDFLLNNFGMWKSYGAGPAGRLSNEGMIERHQQEIRTYLSKNLDYHLANGHDEDSSNILLKVQRSFAKQYINDPRMAQDKFNAWLKKHEKAVGQHPRLRNWSQEELKHRVMTAAGFAKEARGQARDEMLKFLAEEQRIRKMGSAATAPGVAGKALNKQGAVGGGLL